MEDSEPHPLSEINEIGKLCYDIEQLIKEKVQNNLLQLQTDSLLVESKAKMLLSVDDGLRAKRRTSFSMFMYVYICTCMYLTHGHTEVC